MRWSGTAERLYIAPTRVERGDAAQHQPSNNLTLSLVCDAVLLPLSRVKVLWEMRFDVIHGDDRWCDGYWNKEMGDMSDSDTTKRVLIVRVAIHTRGPVVVVL